MTIVLLLVAILLCILLSAFFSASEMAFSSSNTIRLENAAEDGSRRAAVALKVTENFEDALGAILIGNNLVNIASSSLGSIFVILLTGKDEKTWISTLILTALIIVFGETIPKITAKKNANAVSERFAFGIRILMIVLKPLIWLFVGLTKLLTFWMKGEQEEEEDEAVEELQSIIETAEDEEVLDEERSELVQAAIDFPEISAYEVMTARVDVEAIDIEDDWEDILAQIENSSFSRLPVYEESIDHIIGVLYLNHFLKSAIDEGDTDIRSLLMPPCYVYKTMKLPAVMNQLKRAKQHLAIVCDEYGGTLGVLTMEDIIEQIVGEIWDETDTVENEIIRRSEDELELDGDMVITDFLELFEIPEDEFEAESETVGGWTIESFDGKYPQVSDSFAYKDLTITVLSMDGRRVERVLVKREQKEEKVE